MTHTLKPTVTHRTASSASTLLDSSHAIALTPILLCLLFVAPTHARATIRYVSTNGFDRGPYTNWVDAARNIVDAVGAATNGDTIVVGDGQFAGGINIGDKGITIRSLSGPLKTIINAGQWGRILTLYNCVPCRTQTVAVCCSVVARMYKVKMRPRCPGPDGARATPRSYVADGCFLPWDLDTDETGFDAMKIWGSIDRGSIRRAKKGRQEVSVTVRGKMV